MENDYNLLESVKSLPEPAGFTVGITGQAPFMPFNILSFHREREMLIKYRQVFLKSRWQLMVALEGSGDVIVDGRLLHLEKKSAMLVFPHQSHYYADLQGDDLHWLFITFEMKDCDSSIELLKNRTFALTDNTREYLANGLDCYHKHGSKPYYGNEIAYWLGLCLSEFTRKAESVSAGVKKKGIYNPKQELINRISTYIHSNVSRQITLEEIADEVSLSTSHLCAIFKKHLNVSLGRFIRQTKTHIACGLLISSDMNITEIAEYCGAETVYAFSRAFKNMTGLSPLAYRKHFSAEEK
ncbi:MAG: helix-turn-helix transcriptional regulator [Planctomycetes bacterium]|nr:helix-turn-helix transcriptional regulator [Planctomycetota bacterium]